MHRGQRQSSRSCRAFSETHPSTVRPAILFHAKTFPFRPVSCRSFFALVPSDGLFAGSDTHEVRSGVPRFDLNQAILTALRQNPTIQIARQEIERTKGLYIQMRAAALPQIAANPIIQNTDPHLGSISTGSGGGLSAVPTQYSLSLQATQVVFAGGRVVSQIRSADFQRDASYYSFRNAIDQVVETTRQQFYQVLLNRALIGVQETSIQLLKSQLQDQQNRFEAGTVPRFNVLQAQVALSNQQPQLLLGAE